MIDGRYRHDSMTTIKPQAFRAAMDARGLRRRQTILVSTPPCSPRGLRCGLNLKLTGRQTVAVSHPEQGGVRRTPIRAFLCGHL